MHIRHETDIPYAVIDKRTNSLKIKLEVEGNDESDQVNHALVLYGDTYDYQDGRSYCWNYKETKMNLRYLSENLQVWEAAIPVLEWKRLKYTFSLTLNNGEEYLFNEYGLEIKNSAAIDRLLNSYYSHFFYPYIFDEDIIQFPEWVGETIWYQIFPDRFRRGNNEKKDGLYSWNNEKPQIESCYGGDLCGIIQKLDYLEKLGVNGIYLTPIFKAGSNHKYDTINYFEIDPQFGTKKLLKKLVDKVHEKGMHIILDGVFNHISHEHLFWKDVLKKQELSKYKDYFCIKKFPVDTSVIHSKELNYETFSFVATMPKLNYGNPKVKEYIISIIEYWIKECGIDGWRFDVGNELSFCFYEELKKRLKPIKDNIYIIAEIWHDSNRWMRNGYIDSNMNYSLCSAINDYALYQRIDGEGFNNRYLHLLSRLSIIHSELSFNLLDSHDTKRVMNMANHDKIKVKNAFIMLFLLPGSPCLYYGTEIGLCGGDDPDNRRPMIWDENRWDMELYTFFNKIIIFRKENTYWIQKANMRFVNEDGFNIWSFTYGEEKYTLIHNVSVQSHKILEGKIMICTAGEGQVLEPNGMALCECAR
ncbi:MAG: alpha amylase N-terminal ig-like domain-containing protein [Lachnospiraceae bacterium]